MAHHILTCQSKKRDPLMDKYVGDLTQEMNKFLIIDPEVAEDKEFCETLYRTYILPEKEDKPEICVAFRVPGATRGHIKYNTETHEILEIKFYEETSFKVFQCYKPEVVEHMQQFIGDTIEFQNE